MLKVACFKGTWKLDAVGSFSVALDLLSGTFIHVSSSGTRRQCLGLRIYRYSVLIGTLVFQGRDVRFSLWDTGSCFGSTCLGTLNPFLFFLFFFTREISGKTSAH